MTFPHKPVSHLQKNKKRIPEDTLLGVGVMYIFYLYARSNRLKISCARALLSVGLGA